MAVAEQQKTRKIMVLVDKMGPEFVQGISWGVEPNGSLVIYDISDKVAEFAPLQWIAVKFAEANH